MKNIEEKLAGVRTIGISGHVRPDGDCVGAVLALYNYIRDYDPDIDVRPYLEPIPNVYRFLKGSETICDPRTAEAVPAFDLFIAVDCGDASRLGAAAEFLADAGTVVCIDHHVSDHTFASDNYVREDASSTCELVFELMDVNRITEEIAACLYTGIINDTGVFQYSCTSAKTMNVAGILMEKGIDYPKIVNDTFYIKTYNQNRVMGQALVDSRLYLDGRCIVSAVSLEQMREFDVQPKHMEGIVSQLRVTKGVEIALFFYGNEDGTWKGSLRVNSDFNAAEVAAVFGGGGHVKAAGFTIAGSLSECTKRVLSEIEKRLQAA